MDRLPLGADQEILDWLIKITFLVNVKTAVRLGIKSRFGIMGFSHLGPVAFLFNNSLFFIILSA